MQKRVMYSVAHKLLCISRSPPPLLACMSVCSLGVYPQKIKGRENSRIWLINSTHPWQGQNFHQLHVTLFFSITFTSQLISSPSAQSLQWCGAFSPLSDSLFQENHTHWLNRLDGNTNKLWMMFTVKRTSDEKGKKMVKRLHRIEWKDTTCVLHISPDECSKAEEFGTMRRLTELLSYKSCNNTDSMLHSDYHDDADDALLTIQPASKPSTNTQPVSGGGADLCLPTHIILEDYVIIPSAIQFPFNYCTSFSDPSSISHLNRRTRNSRGRFATCLVSSKAIQEEEEEAEEVKRINHPLMSHAMTDKIHPHMTL